MSTASLHPMLTFLACVALLVVVAFVLGAVQDVVYFFQGHESLLGERLEERRARRRGR